MKHVLHDSVSNIWGAGSGGGGKGGSAGTGGGRSAIEDSDTLSSRANIKIIDLLGEGKIGGLVDGAKSIILNGTALMNPAGAYNFSNVTWDSRTGTPDQTVIPGYSSVEVPHDMGSLEITQIVNGLITISNPQVDRIRMVMSVNALWQQDTTNGDIHGTSVSYHFEVSTDGGSSYSVIGSAVNIVGKTKSKYQRAAEFALPKTNVNGQPVTSWKLRIIRTTPDNNSAALANKTFFDSYVEITDVKVNYANSAIVSVGIDPSVFSSPPKRAYYVDGIEIRVPNNYNKATGLYTGVWNGGYQIISSGNPAWVLFDLLTSRRYGLGMHLNEDQIDTAMLYTIGKYCDELVPDGLGGTGKEPRFQINTQIQTRAEAYKLISDITSVFRGVSFWTGGMVCFRQDSPATASMIFTQANVINGEFTYTGSQRRDRHSVVAVTWNDPTDNFKQRIEYVEDKALVNKIGVVKLEKIAFGCTSRGQAHRLGKGILLTEQMESKVITFKVGIDSSLLIPGEVVKIYDVFKSKKRMGGRVASATLTSVTTDFPVTITAGNVKIYIAMPDGSFAERTLLQTTGGTLSTFTWATPLPALPLANALFGMDDQTVPQYARIISIKPDRKNKSQFTINATEYAPGKYAATESEILLHPPKTMPQYVAYVQNMAIDETTYFIAPGVIGSKLHVFWEGQGKLFRTQYRVTVNGGTSNWISSETNVPSLDIGGLEQGSIVDISVSAMNLAGEWSAPALGSKTIAGKTLPPSKPTNLTATGSYGSISLKWTNPSDVDFKEASVWMSTTNNSANAVKITSVYGDTFVFTAPDSATRYFWVTATNTSGRQSDFNAVSGTSATQLTFNVTNWNKASGLVFSVNAATNTVSWTAGTILKDAATTYNISAGSRQWTAGGPIYIYFNPAVADTLLSSTTTLATAVTAGSYPLATYSGGGVENLKGGDGSAFFSGSQLLAGTVGASSLVAGEIISQAAQIRDGIITNAHITSLSASKLTATNVASPFANIGTVTAGVLKSADNSFIIDLDQKFIAIL